MPTFEIRGNSCGVDLWRKLDNLDRRVGARPVRTTDWEERQTVAKRTPLWWTVASLALLVVPAMAILLFQTVRNQREDNRIRVALERDGALAVGSATDFTHPLRWNVFPDAVRVEFTTESGEVVRASVPVSHLPKEGARVEVRYVRTDPSIARVPGDETPHRGRWIKIAVWGPVFCVVMVVILGFTNGFQRNADSL